MKSTGRTQTIFLILALAGMGLVIVSTSVYGAGLSPDSVIYIFAANSLLSGDGYLIPGGDSYVHWPPLFPTLLAGLDRLGIEPLDGARIFNAVVFGLIIFTTGQLLRIHLKTWAIVIVGTASLLVSVILVRISIMAWSEPLFVLLTLLFVIYLSKFLTERRFVFLLLISVLAALACLQRYLGITLVLTGFISIALFMRPRSFPETAKYLGFFSLVSATPIFVWFGRNYSLTSTIAGNRGPSITDTSSTNIFENIKDILYTSSSWLLPVDHVTTLPVKIFLAILGVSVLVALLTVALRSCLRGRSQTQVALIAPAAIFVTIYILSLLVIRSLFPFYAPVGDRLLSPVYIFLLLFVLLGIERLVQASSSLNLASWNPQRVWLSLGLIFILFGILFNEWTASRLLFYGEVENQWVLANLISADGSIQLPFRTIILVFEIFSVFFGLLLITNRMKTWIGPIVITGLCSLWLIYPVAQTYIYVSTKLDSGAGGFNSAGWRESTLIHRLISQPLEGSIYSNEPNAIYILGQIATAESLKRYPYDALNRSATARSQFSSSVASDERETYLVWIDNHSLLDPKRTFESFDNASSMFDLDEIERFPDGGIYLFK